MNRTPGEVLAAIPEAEASGEIREIYAEIRAALGIPVVNTVFRHIATLPGCLRWSWDALRPLYRSGAAERAAESLLGSLPPPPTPPLPEAALHAVGVEPATLPVIARILDTFNRANPINLVALSALTRVLTTAPDGLLEDGHFSASPPGSAPPPVGDEPWRTPAAGRVALPPPNGEALPGMLPLEGMDPRTAGLTWELAAIAAPQGKAAMVALWPSLAHWPGYLALALALLRPLEASGWIAASMHRIETRLDRLARQAWTEGGAATPQPLPEAAQREALTAAVQRFTSTLIVRLIPIGMVLRNSLPTQTPPA